LGTFRRLLIRWERLFSVYRSGFAFAVMVLSVRRATAAGSPTPTWSGDDVDSAQGTSMPRKYTIAYREVTAPITAPVTKFGGQPVWLEAPQWPLSRLCATPMEFIAQIALPPDLFPAVRARLAYLFMSGNEADDTWDPNSGENAVILQPGGRWHGSSQPLLTGPSLHKGMGRTRTPCELAVELQVGDDPAEGAWDDVHYDDQGRWAAYCTALAEDKIGGIAVPTVNSAGGQSLGRASGGS
jgi:hypothetical protein